MKKHLIALAAVATTGLAFGQTVTISGDLGFGYASSTAKAANGTKTKSNGLEAMSGNIKLTAVEDLGGGMKMTMQTQLDSRGRGSSVATEDASLTLSGNFGSVLIGAIDTSNGIIGLGGAGAPVWGLDGGVIDGGDGNRNVLTYTSPELVSGLTVNLTMFDATGAGGMQGAATTTDGSVVGVNYAAGALALNADYTSYGQNNAGGSANDDRFRISASYDLGVAVIGAGFQTLDTVATSNNTTKEYIVGVTVPMGQFAFGFNYARSKVEGNPFATKGYDLGVQYNLSKRTYLAVHYQSADNYDGSSAAQNNDFSAYRVRLNHSF